MELEGTDKEEFYKWLVNKGLEQRFKTIEVENFTGTRNDLPQLKRLNIAKKFHGEQRDKYNRDADIYDARALLSSDPAQVAELDLLAKASRRKAEIEGAIAMGKSR